MASLTEGSYRFHLLFVWTNVENELIRKSIRKKNSPAGWTIVSRRRSIKNARYDILAGANELQRRVWVSQNEAAMRPVTAAIGLSKTSVPQLWVAGRRSFQKE